MILITLAGDSSRFFKEGFTEVKYKLPLNGKTVIESILNFIPRDEKLLIVLNKKFNDLRFIHNTLVSMNFLKFKIVEINKTKGQFETTILGLMDCFGFWEESESLTIYNGDTVRKIYNWKFNECDGFIEVFESEGSHWSFVDKVGKVNKVVEKNRISSYCSSGLYYFKEIKYLLDFNEEYNSSKVDELYIAPFYNLLIQNNYEIVSGIVDKSDFLFCGTPSEYFESINLC